MKRLAALILVLAMMFTMAGCSGNKEPEKGPEAPPVAETELPQESKEENSDLKWPERPIQLIVPLGAGGDTDLCARLFSTYLEKELGTSIVVNNIKGSGGVTGSREVLNAAPDGYTMLFYQYAALVNMVNGSADFSYIDDFEVVGIGMEDNCAIWLANADAPFDSLAELIELAKKEPGKYNIALSGTTNMSALQAGAMEEASGADFNFVDLGSTPEQFAALLSNQIAAFTNYYSSAKSYIDSGDVKVIAVYSPERHELLPDVPTMKECGVDMEAVNRKFYYYAFPKDTPAEIVDAFSSAMKRVCNNPEAQKEFFDQYYITLTYMDPAESDAYMRKTYEAYNEYAYLFK